MIQLKGQSQTIPESEFIIVGFEYATTATFHKIYNKPNSKLANLWLAK